MEKIRSRVSTLPTRLLAFDSTGAAIRLVDHREATYFLADIIFADMDKGIDWLPELLQELEQDPAGNFYRGLGKHMRSRCYIVA